MYNSKHNDILSFYILVEAKTDSHHRVITSQTSVITPQTSVITYQTSSIERLKVIAANFNHLVRRCIEKDDPWQWAISFDFVQLDPLLPLTVFISGFIVKRNLKGKGLKKGIRDQCELAGNI